VLSPQASPRLLPRLSFSQLGAGVTAATVLVVLFGAVVRITGSGAGCGQHWPSCNGEIAHLPKSVETWIELSHRATSGLDFLGVLGLMVVARQRFANHHPARAAATAAFVLILVEVLIGARLVLLNLVGSNLSIDRVVIMPAHLVTTSLLLGALTAATYFGSDSRATGLPAGSPVRDRERLGAARSWVAAAATLLMLVSMTGAVTALGDTVYPVQGTTTLEHWQSDQAEGAHLLGRLRALHPLLALFGVAGLWAAAARARAATATRGVQVSSLGLYAGGGAALLVGLANLALGAPGYLQVAHLLVACLLWINVVWLLAMLWDAHSRRAE